MRIAFDSSHVTGDFSSGLLTVDVRIEDDALGQTILDDIEFEVPADFHTHNDAVAAALMTLAGRKYGEVTFNFPISTFCVETLRRYYGEIAIAPVDPTASARTPGRRIAINFSGGLDSLASWLLTRELYGDDFAVITTEYRGGFWFEEQGFGAYQRDVTCRTNFRRKRFNREGRFHFCVPLLFAEYLDLWGIATGHGLAHVPSGMADYRAGGRPAFLFGDLVVNAGGLEDVHLLSALTDVGVAKITTALGPDRIERALSASSPPNSGKTYTAALIFRHLFEDAGRPIPPFLEEHTSRMRHLAPGEHILRLLYLCKRDEIDKVAAYCPDIRLLDLSFLDGLTLAFMERYNPIFVELLHPPLPERTRAIFHACGIEPYDERDWDELAVVRRFLKGHIERYRDLPD